MHRGTCGTHVPWCMLISLTHSARESVPSIPSACANHSFTYLARSPYMYHSWSLSYIVIYDQMIFISARFQWLGTHLLYGGVITPIIKYMTNNFIFIIKCGEEWLIHSKTWIIQPLGLGNISVISSLTLLNMWLFIHFPSQAQYTVTSCQLM